VPETVVLDALGPRPLGAYFKALGLLRVVAEQRDRNARLWFQDGAALLRSALDGEALVAFLHDAYRPSPILSPWNADGGVGPDGTPANELAELLARDDPRLAELARAAHAAGEVRRRFGPQPKDEEKTAMLVALRAELPEAAVAWLDAAWAVRARERGVAREPNRLLGSGGNDGRLEFSRLFARALVYALPEGGGSRRGRRPSGDLSRAWLRAALWRDGGDGGTALVPDRMTGGLFLPGSTGGANATVGAEAEPLGNPWDIVLMLEGVLLWGAVAVRHLRPTARPHAAFPFTFPPSPGGPGVSDEDLENAAEVWAPVWSRPASLAEVRQLVREGRAEWRGRPAAGAVEAALAARSLGVQRGLSAFERYGLQVRNGRSLLAVELGRFPVRDDPDVRLLAPLDRWRRQLEEAERSRAGAAVRTWRRRVEDSLLAYLAAGGRSHLRRFVATLAEAEWTFARTAPALAGLAKRGEAAPPPLPLLPAAILARLDDGSVAFSLAAAMAGQARVDTAGHLVRARAWWEPVVEDPSAWRWRDDHPDGPLPEGEAAFAYLARAFARTLRAVRDDRGGGTSAARSGQGGEPASAGAAEAGEGGAARRRRSPGLRARHAARVGEVVAFVHDPEVARQTLRWLRLALLFEPLDLGARPSTGWSDAAVALAVAAARAPAGLVRAEDGEGAPPPLAPNPEVVELLAGGGAPSVAKALQTAAVRLAVAGVGIDLGAGAATWRLEGDAARRLAAATAVPVRTGDLAAPRDEDTS
jgi:CRISPR-associated protein Csx17